MRGHVRRHGNGWQAIVYAGIDPESGKKRYLRDTRKTKAAADDACVQLLLKVGRGEHLAKDCTVAEMVDRWVTNLGDTWSPSRRAAVASHVRTKIKAPAGGSPTALGVRLAKDVRTRDLDLFYGRLRRAGGVKGQALARSTVETTHRILSAAYEEAIRCEILQANPATRANLGPTEDSEVVPPTDDEVVAILDWLAGHDHALLAYVTTSADAGNRRGELHGARWSDLDVQRRELRLRHSVVNGDNGVVERLETKGKRSRRLTLSRSTMVVLAEHRRHMAERALAVGVPLEVDGYMFSDDPACRTFWLPNTTSHRFIRARRAARVGEHVQLRNLRHYVASALISSGVDIVTVSKRLGHRKVSTTLDVYSHLVAAADQGAADVMDRKLRRPGTAG